MLQCVTVYSRAMDAEKCGTTELAGNDFVKQFLALFAPTNWRATIWTQSGHNLDTSPPRLVLRSTRCILPARQWPVYMQLIAVQF